jgi:hypothetical protein
MKRFLRNLGLFLAVQLLPLGLILSTAKLDPGDYYRTLLDKEQRLREATSPRVIFVGGSSIAYSLDSERVEREMGVSPVNLGVSMHLGLNYILKEVPVSKLRKGDVVALNLEYEHFCGDPLRVFDVFHALKSWPASVLFLDAHAAKRMLDEGMSLSTLHLRKALASLWPAKKDGTALETTPYRRNAFNRYGDGVGQLDLAASLTKDATSDYTLTAPDSGLQTAIEKLNAFGEKCAAQGVAVVFLYPAYPDCFFQRNRDAICQVRADLARHLRIPILNTPEESLAPVGWFYDHPYHLKRHGVEWRTTNVIAHLEKVMDPIKVSSGSTSPADSLQAAVTPDGRGQGTKRLRH